MSPPSSPLTPINTRGPWAAVRFGRPVALSALLVLGLLSYPASKSAAKSSSTDPAIQNVLKYHNSKCSQLVRELSYDKAEEHCIQNLRTAENENSEWGINSSLGSLYLIYSFQGKVEEAIRVTRRRIESYQEKDGADSSMAIGLSADIAKLYEQQGRFGEAEEIFKRVLEYNKQKYGPESSAVGGDYFMLGRMYLKANRHSDAVAMLSQAISIGRKEAGATKGHMAALRHLLGRAQMGTGNLGNAEREMKQVLRILERDSWGFSLLRKAMALQSLAGIYHQQGRRDEVEPALRGASSLIDESGLSEYAFSIELLGDSAALWSQLGRHGEALTQARRATAIHRSRKASRQGPLRPAFQRRVAETRIAVARHMHAIVRVAADAPSKAARHNEEAFEIIQFAHESSASAAIAQMTARFATRDDALAGLVREQQDAIRRRRGLENALTRLVTAAPKQRNPSAEARVRDELAALENRIREIDQRMARDFPKFSEIMSLNALGLAEAQDLLSEEEALLAYFVADEESYVWVVRNDAATLQPIDIGREELEELVALVRTGLDQTGILRLSDIAGFDFETAYDLYRRIFAPIESRLEGVTHIIQIPDGALQSLPLGVLVSSVPSVRPGTFAGYAEAGWLAKRFAFAVLPSVSSLRALRRFARAAKSKAPFVGFGEPLLQGDPATKRTIPLASLFNARGVADVQAVRQLPALPGTAEELRRIGRSLGADESNLFLRERATERQLWNAGLEDYRVIAFATHGLVAGDLTGLAEPALVMTPPAKPTEADDGLLTASEITGLKLDADWIILSACNTAAPDGTPGSQGFSAFARAFFYAGSRALLVSHWPVISDAAVDLTTRAFDILSEDRTIGRSEALRRSMLALMSDPEKPHYAHPMFWAPFVVVGEGGTPIRGIGTTTAAPAAQGRAAARPGLFVTVKNANVRAGPSTNAARITTLPKGTRVSVLERAPGGAWVRIARRGGASGYVHGSLIEAVAK